MPTLDKSRILNESQTKVLVREFNNLKNDYNRINAIKYKTLYENADLSFILENSRYIFSEPMKGFDFYKSIMESTLIPFNLLEKEYEKVTEFVNENVGNMPTDQAKSYNDLLKLVTERCENCKYTIALYNGFVKDKDAAISVYDDLYKFERTADIECLDRVKEFCEDTDNTNIVDVINISIHVPEVTSLVYEYVNNLMNTDEKDSQNYLEHVYCVNTLKRMMSDKYISEKVSMMPNMNARYILQSVGAEVNSTNADLINEMVCESVSSEIVYTDPLSMINRIYAEKDLSSVNESLDVKHRLDRYYMEKAIFEMEASFLSNDYLYLEDTDILPNKVVEDICVERTDIEKIPQTISGQLQILQEKVESLGTETKFYEEKYFNGVGGASKVVANSTLGLGDGKNVSQNLSDLNKQNTTKDEKENKDDDKEFTPHLSSHISTHSTNSNDDPKTVNDFFGNSANANTVSAEISKQCSVVYKAGYKDIKFDDKEESLGYEPSFKEFKIVDGEAKALLTIKDEDFFNGDGLDFQDAVVKELEKSKFADDYSFTSDIDGGIVIHKKSSTVKEAAEDDTENNEKENNEEPKKKEKPVKVDKPDKPNVFRRIQNKALDADVQFKKKVANAKRTGVDARNAGKAVMKIPTNIFTAVKKQINEWDELDDNRRKEYIIKPGFRKKYFRALRICLMHYGAFAINPVLNIVLFICQKLSKTKDLRIRNELTRELKAEIKVTEEKINDANANGDQQQKYKLMRIKEKLEAEMARVTLNSTTV